VLDVPVHDASRSADVSAPKRARRSRVRRAVLAGLLAIWAGTAAWQTHKPLPDGLRVAPAWQAVSPRDVRFIADITTADAYGRPVVSQAIFDEVLAVIAGAREFIVADFFLFNGHRGTRTGEERKPVERPLARELSEALIARKARLPRLQVLFITDPINEVYGGERSQQLAALRAAGIEVVSTDLERLRDSNPSYSALWRLALWWTQWLDPRWLPHPFDDAGPAVGLQSWARLANFKANHRKVLLADDGRGGLTGIVSSANPHDASSAHSNVALRLSGAVLEPLLRSELAVARFSGAAGTIVRGGSDAPPAPIRAVDPSNPAPPSIAGLGTGRVIAARVLTEGAIRDALVERIAATVRGEAIELAMFYLSERAVVEALLAASERGVTVRLILDPNKDAFGRTKSGIPNRQVAGELVSRSGGDIKVRWYRTHGEQFHAKLVLVRGADRVWLTAGSANLTRRNIRDYNLEANVALEAGANTDLATQVTEYFETLWSNRAPLGIEYTADFDVYADPSQLRYWQYRFMEASGLSTF
jgi:phosphatidylserine/phosphatidylglycerophosphate/cardiolipin synthase-like enzyme